MWNYAKLSKLARSCGGPERLVEKLIDSGVKKGRLQMLPVTIVAFLIGIAIGPIVEYFKKKRAQSDRALEEAKAELIQGIKDYDAEHPHDA